MMPSSYVDIALALTVHSFYEIVLSAGILSSMSFVHTIIKPNFCLHIAYVEGSKEFQAILIVNYFSLSAGEVLIRADGNVIVLL